MHVKDEWVRRREEAVRRLLEHGILRTEKLIEVFLQVSVEEFLSHEEALLFFANRSPEDLPEGEAPPWLGIDTCAIAMEALNPGLGDRVADMLAVRGYMSALFSELVGADGEVSAIYPGSKWSARKLRKTLRDYENISVISGEATTKRGLSGDYDVIWLGAALPTLPEEIGGCLRDPSGRMVTLIGPRIRAQDLVCLTCRDEALQERQLARIKVPIVAGPNGWLARPRAS